MTSPRTRRLLELGAIIDQLATRCETPVGRERARLLEPSLELEEIQRRQQAVSEARQFLETHAAPPMAGLRDIRAALHQARHGGALEPADILHIAAAVNVCFSVRRAVLDAEADNYPHLHHCAGEILSDTHVAARIEHCLDDEGQVRDRASAELRRLRHDLDRAQRRVRSRMESIVSDSRLGPMLQEPLVTVRQGRFVVPVRSEHRAQFGGIVHDRSSSGATFFVEPESVVELNNEVRRLELAARDEELRILRELTALVADHAVDLRASFRRVADLDMLFAAARLSIDWDACSPQLTERPEFDLVQARHPLLGDDAVPIDIAAGPDCSVVVITGPNTGGKTVTLKTVGLLCLMTQCGLHIPARENTVMGLFPMVFADIGDEQSIAHSLSTFAAHMRHICTALRDSRPGMLCLLDELGVGTDPDEGAALAKSVLLALQERGAVCLVSTHYSALKTFAFGTAGMENYAVEFDLESLRPTYRLLRGATGSSNAFDIAERLGLAENVVARARHMRDREQSDAAEAVREAESTRRRLESEREEVARRRERAEALESDYERRLESLESELAERRRLAEEEARELLRTTRREAEEILRELRRAQREGKATQQAMDRLRAIEREHATRPAQPEELAIPARLRPGVAVRVESLRRNGVLLSPPDAHGNVVVRVGAAQVTVHAGDVQVVDAPPESESPAVRGADTLRLRKALSVPSEVHLRHMSVEEALHALDKYIDDAVLAGLSEVRVVHGKGQGILRQVTHDYLRDHPAVAGFRLAAWNAGGDGVTVVDLGGGG